MCGADCWTDRRLTVSKLNIRTEPMRRPKGKKAPKRLIIAKVKDTNVRQSFVNTLEDSLDSTPMNSQNVKADWATLRELVYNTDIEKAGLV